ncbi:hypothetical protein ACO1O0_003982 [Amphichorda felina]
MSSTNLRQTTLTPLMNRNPNATASPTANTQLPPAKCLQNRPHQATSQRDENDILEATTAEVAAEYNARRQLPRLSPTRILAQMNEEIATYGSTMLTGSEMRCLQRAEEEAERKRKKRATAAALSRKRKSGGDDADDIKALMFPPDAPEIDEDDGRLYYITDSCQQTRRKVRNWIESGAMKVGEFQKELGISSKGYGNFMNRNGTWDGQGCDMYSLAARFFKKRELQGLPLAVPKAKKAKTASGAGAAKGGSSSQTQEQLLDVSGVEIPGEEVMEVSIYETCDESRKKIRALLAKGVTQTALARTLDSMYPEGSGKSVTAATLRYFLGQKGPLMGNTGSVFYAAYLFFEKRRLKDGKPKSEYRELMEELHYPMGVDTKVSMSTPVLCSAGSIPVVDRYGMRSTI